MYSVCKNEACWNLCAAVPGRQNALRQHGELPESEFAPRIPTCLLQPSKDTLFRSQPAFYKTFTEISKNDFHVTGHFPSWPFMITYLREY